MVIKSGKGWGREGEEEFVAFIFLNEAVLKEAVFYKIYFTFVPTMFVLDFPLVNFFS